MDERPLVLVDLDGVLWHLPFGVTVNFRRKSVAATRPEPQERGLPRRLVGAIYWWPLLWGPSLRRVNYEVAAAIGTNSDRSGRFLAVTNRPPRLSKVTRRLLGLAGLPDLPVHYNDTGLPSAYFKLDEARSHQTALFIEDDLMVANFLARGSITAVLLDRTYNAGETEPGVFRTSDRELANILSGTIRLLRPQ